MIPNKQASSYFNTKSGKLRLVTCQKGIFLSIGLMVFLCQEQIVEVLRSEERSGEVVRKKDDVNEAWTH